ncbi:MAG: hypothetical protein ND895_28315 [Pyrinomonadaceae bacterium]|nr:hypothetical protein [Pyrinomonadaceae bacterium]
MKLSLQIISTEDAAQTTVPPSANYEVLERDVLPGEAFDFLNRLVSPQDMIYLEQPRCSIDFWKHDESLWVEIYSAELWATSEVSDTEARAIIDMLDRGDSFGNSIPMTNREWDAYAPLGNNTPTHLAAT